MSELSIKASVRERDGYRCRDCGMTSEEHQEKYRSELDVHRLIPGIQYVEFWCVTLCTACHGKKARRCEDLIFKEPDQTGVACITLNLYDPHIRRMAEIISSRAGLSCKGFEEYVIGVLMEHAQSQPLDYCI